MRWWFFFRFRLPRVTVHPETVGSSDWVSRGRCTHVEGFWACTVWRDNCQTTSTRPGQKSSKTKGTTSAKKRAEHSVAFPQNRRTFLSGKLINVDTNYKLYYWKYWRTKFFTLISSVNFLWKLFSTKNVKNVFVLRLLNEWLLGTNWIVLKNTE